MFCLFGRKKSPSGFSFSDFIFVMGEKKASPLHMYILCTIMNMLNLPAAKHGCIIRSFSSWSMTVAGNIVRFGIAVFLTKNLTEHLESFINDGHKEYHNT